MIGTMFEPLGSGSQTHPELRFQVRAHPSRTIAGGLGGWNLRWDRTPHRQCRAVRPEANRLARSDVTPTERLRFRAPPIARDQGRAGWSICCIVSGSVRDTPWGLHQGAESLGAAEACGLNRRAAPRYV